jgi:hypothetical protein
MDIKQEQTLEHQPSITLFLLLVIINVEVDKQYQTILVHQIYTQKKIMYYEQTNLKLSNISLYPIEGSTNGNKTVNRCPTIRNNVARCCNHANGNCAKAAERLFETNQKKCVGIETFSKSPLFTELFFLLLIFHHCQDELPISIMQHLYDHQSKATKKKLNQYKCFFSFFLLPSIVDLKNSFCVVVCDHYLFYNNK